MSDRFCAPRLMAAAVLPLAIALACAGVASAQTTSELKRMTLEELMGVEVSTLSKVLEPSSEVPAAVFVITQDDIRRSGATSLPEVLRLAPGVQVARIDASRYAIGMRGFADRLSRGILVLMDGRAVYSPLFAGTYWEVQHTLLADIERIEVIRGPGGTLWGSNAVNGIINIITKVAADTQGLFVEGDAGTAIDGSFGVRFGGSKGTELQYRAYATGFDRDAEQHADGSTYDQWHMVQSGFRADWSLAHERTFTAQGDVYTTRLGERSTHPLFTSPYSQTVTRDAPVGGGNFIARWSAPTARHGRMQLQVYYDRTSRDELPVSETRNTVDVDFQHELRLPRHQLVWGLGYRFTHDGITAVQPSAFDPPSRTDNLYSAFVQDGLVLVPERLHVTFGTKIEHNAYSGVELQPSARALWTINADQNLFASATRAVRTPSRVETDYSTQALVSPAVPTFVALQPNSGFESEKLIAYETGYRFRPIKNVFATVSAFVNQLDDILSTELETPFVETTPIPHLVLPVQFRNGLHGNSHGAEFNVDWRTTPWLRTTAAYSYLQIQLTRDAGSTDVSQERRDEGLSPNHQVQFQVSADAGRGIQLDLMGRYVSALPAGPVPAYTAFNARLGWAITPRIEVSLVGQDLGQASHQEWPTDGGSNILIRPSGFVRVTWKP